MSNKFKNKYRVDSSRLKNWDYSWAGAYFITICTKDRKHFFGEIADGKMILSPVGVIADICWHEIKNHAKNVELGEFVVMPNHVHGILILNESRNISNDNASIDDISIDGVETLHATSLPKNDRMAKISPKSNSISTIIRSYKSAVSKHANRLEFNSSWQPRFHDHIIRDEKSFRNISNYIKNNPINWDDDKFHSDNS